MAGEIKRMVLMLLLVSIPIIGAGMFYGSFASHYGSTGVSDISNMSSAGEAQGMATRMRDSIKNSQLTSIPQVDIPFMIISGGYNALMLVFDGIMYVISLISDLIVFSGLPVGWVVSILTAAVSVILVFGILGALLKWEL